MTCCLDWIESSWNWVLGTMYQVKYIIGISSPLRMIDRGVDIGNVRMY